MGRVGESAMDRQGDKGTHRNGDKQKQQLNILCIIPKPWTHRNGDKQKRRHSVGIVNNSNQNLKL